jgi:hypothetical protein
MGLVARTAVQIESSGDISALILGWEQRLLLDKKCFRAFI